MDQRDLELGVISHLLKGEKELSEAREKGVSLKSFVSESKIYEFVTSHLHDYGKLPTRETVQSLFTTTLPENADGEVFIDLLCKRELGRGMTEVLTNGVSKLTADEPEAALEYIQSNLLKMRRSAKYSLSYTDGDAKNRLDQLQQRKSLGKLFGRLFSLPIDRIPPGTMIGIVGRLGIGKSYYLLRLCLDAYSKGKRVLLLSPEMSKEEFEIRWDAVASGHFSPELLLTGAIPVEAYKEWLEKVANRREWITMDSAFGSPFTIPTITQLVNEFKPDILAIDGLPLIVAEGSGTEEGWQGVKRVSYDLQSLAVTKGIYILVTTQASRDATNSTTPELHQVAYGDGFAQACSIIVALGAHQDEKKRYMAIPKNRYGKAHRPVEIPFRPEDGIIG